MPYRIRDDLYYCRADERVVFMDILADSYFLLRDNLEPIFLAYISGYGLSQKDLETLSAHGLLTDGESTALQSATNSICLPTRSAAEESPMAEKAAFKTTIEVARIVYATKKRLQTKKIKEIIEDYRRCWRSEVASSDISASKNNEEHLIKAASEYVYARRFVPIETSCLLDSLSMHTFLSRRQLSANIVFGVTAEPFSAHAWLQFGDLALNETVSLARTHTPILVL